VKRYGLFGPYALVYLTPVGWAILGVLLGIVITDWWIAGRGPKR
jgi:hypothetical protein